MTTPAKTESACPSVPLDPLVGHGNVFAQGVLVCLGIIRSGMDYETIVRTVGADTLIAEATRVNSAFDLDHLSRNGFVAPNA